MFLISLLSGYMLGLSFQDYLSLGGWSGKGKFCVLLVGQNIYLSGEDFPEFFPSISPGNISGGGPICLGHWETIVIPIAASLSQPGMSI